MKDRTIAVIAGTGPSRSSWRLSWRFGSRRGGPVRRERPLPAYNQLDPEPNCSEASSCPAAPDSEYCWETFFSERLYLAYGRNYGMEVRMGGLERREGKSASCDLPR
jgi:hypothetical protein